MGKITNQELDSSIQIGELSELTTIDKNSLINAVNELNSNKVDKEVGKGLSTNDYTTDEKNKLAGIESGATADMSATEILTAIKTIDGTDSGLDADLLDGQHGSYYAPLDSPTFTGTVALPSTTSIGNVSNTEIGYLDGVTSAVQTQLNAKVDVTGDTFEGVMVAQSNTSYATKQVRNIILSTADAVLDSMADGDIWIKYT